MYVDRKIEIQKVERLDTFNRRFRPVQTQKCKRAVKSQVEIQKLCM